jgi:lipopolysaccharide export system protein LptA
MIRFASLFLLIGCCCSGVLAQSPVDAPAKPRTPIVYESKSYNAIEDSLGKRSEMHGDVKITKDSLTVTCQDAVYYPESGILLFRNNVDLEDRHRILLADEVTYNEFSEEIFASGRVRVYQKDSLSIQSRTAKYAERFKAGTFFDDVKIRDEHRRLTMTGQLGFVDHDRKYGRMTGNPIVTERDSTYKLLTEVRGDTVEYFGQEKRVRVTGHVSIERDSLVATGTLLDYFSSGRMAILLGNPEAVRDSDHVRGDTMKLYFEEEKLSKVEVLGHSETTSPADSGFALPRNKMQGKQMTLWVKDGKLQEALIEGNATATYFVREKGQKKGINVTSGDRVRIFFEQRKMSRIRVEGGTEGTYKPQRLLKSEDEG